MQYEFFTSSSLKKILDCLLLYLTCFKLKKIEKNETKLKKIEKNETKLKKIEKNETKLKQNEKKMKTK